MGRGPLAASVRRGLRPQVGLAAILSALGDVRPPWEQQCPAAAPPRASSRRRTKLGSSGGGRRSDYHVGRARVRCQLDTALGTREEPAQLRRLQQALASTARHDARLEQDLRRASSQAALLARRLAVDRRRAAELRRSSAGARPAPGAAAAEQQAAGVSSCCAAAAAGPAEEFGPHGQGARHAATEQEEARRWQREAAATSIQSLYRGRAARCQGSALGEREVGDLMAKSVELEEEGGPDQAEH